MTFVRHVTTISRIRMRKKWIAVDLVFHVLHVKMEFITRKKLQSIAEDLVLHARIVTTEFKIRMNRALIAVVHALHVQHAKMEFKTRWK